MPDPTKNVASSVAICIHKLLVIRLYGAGNSATLGKSVTAEIDCVGKHACVKSKSKRVVFVLASYSLTLKMEAKISCETPIY